MMTAVASTGPHLTTAKKLDAGVLKASTCKKSAKLSANASTASSAQQSQAKKKQAKAQPQQQPQPQPVTHKASHHGGNGSVPTVDEAVTATATATASAKKNAAKKPDASKPVQPYKLARDKERKDKLLKNGLALDASTTPTRLQDMEQDSVKSRNRKLFLAPASSRREPLSARPSTSTTASTTPASTGPCWGHSAKTDAHTHSVAESLHTEILEYAQYTRATVAAMTVDIEQMITNVRSCVHALWPKSRVEPFGSYSTGIWLPSSDVDLVILGVVEIHDRSLTVSSLRQLAATLRTQPWVESLVVLDTAKIPVLKLVTAASSVPMDLTFESSATHSGLLARDLIKRYAEEMPELYPLAVVFKQLLRERELNDVYTGGLSSYAIVLMLIHFQMLWRYGGHCFQAASVFASGAPLPRPADLIADEKRRRRQRGEEQGREQDQVPASAMAATPSPSPVAWKSTLADLLGKPAETSASASSSTSVASTAGKTVSSAPWTSALDATGSSFAAVVAARPKSLKRPVTEAGRSASQLSTTTATAASSQQQQQIFSYAAVAAGIAKRSSQAAAPPPPPSYAAAVAATKSATSVSSSSSSRTHDRRTTTTSATVSASASPSSKTASEAALDAMSVTSSNADTEDASSCSESTSTTGEDGKLASSPTRDHETDLDVEALAVAAGGPPRKRGAVSLGEHTLTILEFFGTIFDYRRNGLSVRDGGYVYRLADTGPSSNGTGTGTGTGSSKHAATIAMPALVIEDPIHPDRNVSASSFAFSKVVAVFEDAFYALTYFRPSRFTPSALSCLLSTSGHTLHGAPLHMSSSPGQANTKTKLKPKSKSEQKAAVTTKARRTTTSAASSSSSTTTPSSSTSTSTSSPCRS